MRILLGLAAAAPVTAHGACPMTRATTADLVAALDEVKLAYTDVAPEAFRAAADKARGLVPCLSDAIGHHEAAELHRTEGLAAFVDRNPERASLAFAAARSLEPRFEFPTSLVPEGHPVARAYAEAQWTEERIVLVPPKRGHLAFDGRESQSRPADQPTVVQIFGEDGRVDDTAYLWPGQPMPDYPLGDPLVPGAVSSGEDAATKQQRARARNWWIGAGASALAAGVFYGANKAVHDKYEDPDTPVDQLDDLRTANNALAVASGVSLAGAVGLGVTAVVTSRF
jgi:hypothetical protein